MRRPLLLLAVLLAVAHTTAVPASAHTQVQDATPGPGEHAGGTVEWVVVDFLDPVQPTPDVDVVGPDGAPVAGIGEPRMIADDVVRLSFDPLDEPGRYTVSYRWIALDGAEQSSSHQFTYEPSDPVLDASARTVSAVVVGVVVLALVGWALLDRRRSRSVEVAP